MKIEILDRILSKKCFYKVGFTCWFFIGIILSIFDLSLKNNYIYVFGLNFLMFFQIFTYQNLMLKEENVSKSFSGVKLNNYPLLFLLNDKLNYINKWYSIGISFLIGIIYFILLITLKVLTLNELITFYGALTLIPTVFIAIQLYLKYLLYILTLRKISQMDFTTLTPVLLYDPSNSEWIVKFTDTMNSFSFYFAIIGSAYTMLFYLTTPLSAITFFENKLIINTPNNLAFIITWGIIFVLIGFGYLILDYIWKKYIKTIVKKIKKMQLNQYADVLNDSIEINKDYIELFKLYRDSSDFPLFFNGQAINLFAYIPILINLYNLFKPFISQK